MESYDFVHAIKAHKGADAVTRRILFTNFTKTLQLMEVFVAVALISWSSIRLPLVFKLSGEYLLVFTSYLMNQHVVFLLGNVIGFLCYVLSRYTDSGNEPESTHQKTVVADSLNHQPLVVTETPSSGSQNLVSSHEKTVSETVTEPEVMVVTTIKEATKQIERFRRTQSDLKKKTSVNRKRKLRRSVTSCDGDATVRSSPAVDELSNEEFRVAVEKFIMKQQMFLKQQRMVEA